MQEGKPRGMRGMTGEFEKPNEGNDRGMRGNQMTVEWEGNEGKWGETEWTGEW
jgi:hypothetical protein